MKKIITLLAAFILFISCENNDTVNNNSLNNRVYYNSNITSILFETNGGCTIKFQIIPEDNGYAIDVSKYNFKDIDIKIILSNTNEQEYILVAQIFNKQIDIYNEVFVPAGETGTWTSVTLNYATGEFVKIDNVSPFNKLSILYEYVINNIDSII